MHRRPVILKDKLGSESFTEKLLFILKYVSFYILCKNESKNEVISYVGLPQYKGRL